MLSLSALTMLLRFQKPLTKNALTLRVLTLKENKGLPLMKVKNKYWISVRALEKWLSEQGQ